MALRIGGGAPIAPMMEQEEAVSDPAMMGAPPIPEAPAVGAPMAEPMMGGGTVSPELAHYVGPERMDMACQNCIHFMEPNSCEIVAGMIDPAGTCNLFTQDSGESELPTEPDMSVPVGDEAPAAGY